MQSSPIARAAELLQLGIDDEATRKLGAYRDQIAAAAERFNLTAVRESDAIERRHIVESLALLSLLQARSLLPEGTRIIDIGSGAGLPGLPIAIARADLGVTLLEANAKRCAFLREMIVTIDLPGVSVLEGRAEEWGRDPGHRAAYDLVLARAVAPLTVLIEYALPLLRLGGALAATKGSGAERELAESVRALEELGGEVEATAAFEPPHGLKQSLIIVRKGRETPERYPRRTGIPSKRPLL